MESTYYSVTVVDGLGAAAASWSSPKNEVQFYTHRKTKMRIFEDGDYAYLAFFRMVYDPAKQKMDMHKLEEYFKEPVEIVEINVKAKQK